MIRVIELQTKELGELENLFLVDACVILYSLYSKKESKKLDLKQRRRFERSRKSIDWLLDPLSKQVMCYTSVIWGEVYRNVMGSKEFSEERLEDLMRKVGRTEKIVYMINFQRNVILNLSHGVFRGLEEELAAQHLSLDVNDRSLVYSSLIMGIPTIITYDEHFFRSQRIVSKYFREWELKRMEKNPHHKINYYGIIKPGDFLSLITRL